MQQENIIQCPKCQEIINVQEIVYNQIYTQLKKEQQIAQTSFHNEVEQKRKEYAQAFKALQEKEESLEERIKTATKESLEKEKSEIQKQIKDSTHKEYSKMLEEMQKELNEKSSKLKEFYAIQAEIERLKREKEEIESKVNAKAQAIIAQQTQDFKEKLESQMALQLKEKEKKIQDMQKQLQDAQRTAQSGSQQLQGEVQELALEEYLQTQFPFDTIEEIKKGQMGGDCIQVVHTREMQNCGRIYYESKRTKEFKRDWIEKLKNDMRQKTADIGVLVTETMPKELERMGLLDGIWVCSFREFKALSVVLRDSVIQIHLAKKSQENKQDKMNLLYSYLTSSEFKMQIEAVVEGFTQMQMDLDKEKMAMQKLWKQREKQIQKVLDGTINLYGALKGIAGNAIDNIQSLELAHIAESQEKD